MDSVIVHPNTPIITTIVHEPIPSTLAADQVLIKVHAAASNPKDWLHVLARNQSSNSGDDLAGTIEATGKAVNTLQIGDRVAALHSLGQPFGAYAQYAVAHAHTVFKIPDTLTFEEASTIPLVSMTATLTLFRRQGFVAPWQKEKLSSNERPLLVYAASTALGTNIVKLAKLSGIGPIIAIGGGSSQYLRSLLREDDVFLDYRMGMQQVTSAVRALASSKNLELCNAIDAFSADGSWISISNMLDGGILSVFSGAQKYDEPEIAEGVKILYTFVGSGHEGAYRTGMPRQPDPEDVKGDVEFAAEFFQWMQEQLVAGDYSGHPYEVIEGGLNGIGEGLNRLRDGHSGGKKFVYRVR